MYLWVLLPIDIALQKSQLPWSNPPMLREHIPFDTSAGGCALPILLQAVLQTMHEQWTRYGMHQVPNEVALLDL